MKKPSIPSVNVADPQMNSILNSIKANIEIMTGVRSDPLSTVASNATLAEVIAAVNLLIERMNS
jgi:hypothetical protein